MDSASGEWSKRKTLINEAARAWRDRINGKWKVLTKVASLTTTPSQNYVTLPSGYRQGRALIDKTGYITIGTTAYQLVNRDVFGVYDDQTELCYILGSDPEGFKLYIQPTPTEAIAFDFPYFTKNTATDTLGTTEKEFMVLETDVTKCPNPSFLVEWVLGELYITENEDFTSAKTYKDQAEGYLKSMMVENFRGDVNQAFKVLDPGSLAGFAPLGGYYEGID